MLGSLGCPYTCSFCIDATVPYQPLDFEVMKDDLRFLLKVQKRPRIGWHDPNFGVRFDDYMGAIEEAVPPDRIDFIAESSLSLLTESHLKRLQRNGFKAILPGVESWYESREMIRRKRGQPFADSLTGHDRRGSIQVGTSTCGRRRSVVALLRRCRHQLYVERIDVKFVGDQLLNFSIQALAHFGSTA